MERRSWLRRVVRPGRSGSLPSMGVVERLHVVVSGRPNGQAMLFAHGFGCDQHMWHQVSSQFEAQFRVILFDHVGAGNSDLRAYDPYRYDSLDAYAEDVLAICHELELDDVIF